MMMMMMMTMMMMMKVVLMKVVVTVPSSVSFLTFSSDYAYVHHHLVHTLST